MWVAITSCHGKLINTCNSATYMSSRHAGKEKSFYLFFFLYTSNKWPIEKTLGAFCLTATTTRLTLESLLLSSQQHLSIIYVLSIYIYKTPVNTIWCAISQYIYIKSLVCTSAQQQQPSELNCNNPPRQLVHCCVCVPIHL